MIIYGWGKDLKQVGYAGIEKCPNCKNYGHFWICEHSSHAKLYFIKVAKWNKKLLYMCETCERGWEIEESAKDDAIKRTIALPTGEQALQMWTRLNSAVNAVPAGGGENRQEEVQLILNVITATVKELKATYQEDHVAYVAGRYLAFLQDPDCPK